MPTVGALRTPLCALSKLWSPSLSLSSSSSSAPAAASLLRPERGLWVDCSAKPPLAPTSRASSSFHT
eukprot:2753792-Pleurochrysis_carterae.AAC.3